MDQISPDRIVEILDDRDPGPVAEACLVMHAAFAEYADGQPSGALLETPESLLAEMADGLRVLLVRVGGLPVAMVKFRIADDGSLYFSRLSVHPEARGSGLAALLVGTLRAEAARHRLSGLSCCVRSDELGNIAFYEHLGMEVTGRGDRTSLTGAVIPVVLMSDPASLEGRPGSLPPRSRRRGVHRVDRLDGQGLDGVQHVGRAVVDRIGDPQVEPGDQ